MIDMQLFPETIETGAEFSPCRRYRYKLWRKWGAGRGLTFVMLNPSTAAETENDATITRCMHRAQLVGYDNIMIVNLFALCSTDPQELYLAEDPIGQENDQIILEAVSSSKMVICAWGRHGKFRARDAKVLSLIAERNIEAYCLGLNKDGTPKHPLYVSMQTKPTLISNSPR